MTVILVAIICLCELQLQTRCQLATIILRPAHVLEIVKIALFSELSHYVSQWWSPYLAHITVYISDIKVNDGKSAFLGFDQIDIFEGISLTETIHTFIYSNHLA